MKYRDDLKIELRAILYDKNHHVLQWRIDPNQNLEYTTNNFFGATVTKKYDTDWHQPKIFKFNSLLDSPHYSENDYYKYILFNEKEEFEQYKKHYKTYKELFDHFAECEEWNKKRYKEAHNRYLEKISTWT